MLSNEQKYIRRSMALGVITACIAIFLSWDVSQFITINNHGNITSREYAFGISILLAILPMILMIGRIANLRFFSSGIDGSSTQTIDINVKVLNNTHEQTLLFLIAAFVLAIATPEINLAMVPMLSLVFIYARITFWYGYSQNTIKRAYGFATTFYLNVLILIFAAIRLIAFN